MISAPWYETSVAGNSLPRKIVSGGQTGVDRAALDVALEAGLPCGGWCPRGRLAEVAAGGTLTLRGLIARPDGTELIETARQGAAAAHGLELSQTVDMPANNMSVVLRRA